MTKAMHCPVCGFIMMIEISEDKTSHVCVNTHGTIGKANQGVHLSENLVEVYKGLGNNVDLLLQYLKRP